jgi:hypothetical protein
MNISFELCPENCRDRFVSDVEPAAFAKTVRRYKTRCAFRGNPGHHDHTDRYILAAVMERDCGDRAFDIRRFHPFLPRYKNTWD